MTDMSLTQGDRRHKQIDGHCETQIKSSDKLI